MAAWLQAGTLFFLLAFSAGGANAAATQQLCGADLVDALYLACGGPSSCYRPIPKREVDPLLAAQEGELTKNPYKERTKRRGIVEQCCFKSCSIFDLQNYCCN